MCEIWAAFATSGNPNNDAIAPAQWEPVPTPAIDPETSEIKYKCLNISDDVSFVELPEAERMQFWDSIYKKNKFDLF